MRDIEKGLTQERLHAVLDYNPQTGIFIWRHHPEWPPNVNGRFAGRIAGSAPAQYEDRYVFICVDGHHYRAHRLALFYVTGVWPPLSSDHRNVDKRDNRFVNLRTACQSQNGANHRVNKNNKLGIKGVCWSERDQTYRATLTVKRKQRSCGYYDCPAAASFAYQIAADKHFGEFARFS